ncbi:hypothetical protein Emed_005017 [Eimeria media]
MALALLGVHALEWQAAAGSDWGAPLLLPSLLSPPSHSWRRAPNVSHATGEAASPTIFEQLPHVASAFAKHAAFSEEGMSSASSEKPVKIYRDQYKPLDFVVESIDLIIELDEENTKVTSNIRMHKRPGVPPSDLVLDGDALQLEKAFISGSELVENAETGYTLTSEGKLRISKNVLPENEALFEVQILVTINPKANLELMGLYLSEDTFVTQCEPAGFRRITFYPDRPDVLARFQVRLEADAEKYPVLLSNGNKVDEGSVYGSPGRHFAIFEDPFPKPSYLFAVVAGKLGVLKDSFTTMSGRDVTLQLFTSPSNVHKLELPRDILKQSMRFDEEHFGREYDLDVLNVVCVNDFNAGAMENKGLLIFNCDALLADPATTSDFEYSTVVTVVGHEYFHNWTGNRVTVSLLITWLDIIYSADVNSEGVFAFRDWFELTLKEGLTTFREELFSAAVGSAAVTRIHKMKLMMGRQFQEDAGPLAHPIRPDSYAAVDNLYTLTVYDKGSEVHRMYQTILGVDGFRKGMDLYFERHDGTAVTSEDFRAAMEDANNVDLSQFALWYTQAGTPHVRVEKTSYDPQRRIFSIELSQHTPPTPGQPDKQPQVIPMKIGLIGKKSKTDLLTPPTKVVLLKKESETINFYDIGEDCVPSLFRDFSAPVKLLYERSPEVLAFLMAHDTDPVNKWLAAQKLASSIILKRAAQLVENDSAELEPLPQLFVDALRTTLLDKKTDRFVKALTLRLPEMSTLEQEMHPADPEALYRARRSVILDLTSALKGEMINLYNKLTVHEVERFDQKSLGRRRLRNELLMYLSEFRDREAAERAYKHFYDARCMTDKFYSLWSLASMQQPERDQAFAKFYQDAKDQIERMKQLQEHPDFSFTNPNRLRSLLGAFARSSHHFHRKDGKGYELIADAAIKVDTFNTSIAARLASMLIAGKNLTKDRQAMLQAQLRRILAQPTVSNNVKDIVHKAIDDTQA